MPVPTPTAAAVSDAITHYRQINELSCDELSYVLAGNGYELTAGDIAAIESRKRTASVDDLMAISFALDVSPAVLLTHIPVDMPFPEGPIATGLPADADQAELRAWIESRTSLDPQSRIAWCEDRISRLRIRSAHLEEQLQGAYAEARELGILMEREADALPVVRLNERTHNGEYELNQAELALAMAEQRLDQLREATH